MKMYLSSKYLRIFSFLFSVHFVKISSLRGYFILYKTIFTGVNKPLDERDNYYRRLSRNGIKGTLDTENFSRFSLVFRSAPYTRSA